MKRITYCFLIAAFCVASARAQPSPPDCTNCFQLTSWSFQKTNWQSDAGYSPVKYTNIYLDTVDGGYGNSLSLDTANTDAAFLFYNLIQTNLDSSTFTNLTPQTGTISLWFNPDWSGTNQGGTGPGEWGNLISLGGTNGDWWAWYLSPDGCTMYLTSQTNGGSPSNSISAPVSFIENSWYNLTLVYGPTNTAFYTNGILLTNGTGVTHPPGSNVTFFAIGGDSNGFYQAEGLFSDLVTYNYQLGSGPIWDSYSIITPFYGLAGGGQPLASLPNAPSLDPAPDWFSSPGDLQYVTSAGGCPTNVNVWFTNVSGALQTNGAISLTFTITGGSSGGSYDVFGTTALAVPVTNAVWAWLGRGQTCTTYTITNLPNTSVFLMLGVTNDRDGDGLSDVFERLVSHTYTNAATSFGGLPDAWVALNGLVGTNGLAGLDPDFDGLNNGQEYLYGTQPLVFEGIAPWVGNPSGYSGIP